MRKPIILRLASVLAWILVSVAVSAAQETTIQGALAQADTLVRAGRYPEALAEAQSAIRLAPNQFKPYYYAAFALYKQEQFEDAERYARDSLARATASDREDVQKLVDAIGTRRLIAQRVAVADGALKSGLFAKAAEAYTEAWQSSPDLAEPLGLKAAHLWFESISEPVKAATILNYIVAHPQDPGRLVDARNLLSRMQSALAATYQNDIAEAIKLIDISYKTPRRVDDEWILEIEMVKSPNSDAAISWLKSAATADPRQFYPHLLMADIYSIQGRIEEATNELAGTAQLGVTGSILTKNEFWKYNLYPLALDQPYSARIKDTFGPAVVEQARRLASEHDARNHAAQQMHEFDQQLGQLRDQLSSVLATIGKVQVGVGKIKHCCGGDVYCSNCLRVEYTLLPDGICPSFHFQKREVGSGAGPPDGSLTDENFYLVPLRFERLAVDSVDVKEIPFYNGSRALQVGPFLLPTSAGQVAGKLSSVLNEAKRVCAAKSAGAP